MYYADYEPLTAPDYLCFDPSCNHRSSECASNFSGAAMVFLWKLVISKLGGAFAIYELFPAFIFSSVIIVVVSLLTPKPSKEIEEDFDYVAQ